MNFPRFQVLSVALVLFTVVAVVSGCRTAESKQPAPQPLPVKTETVNLAPVPRQDEYVATIKSRRSANIQPQVDGALTKILVKSGDHVRAGQVLMTIDPAEAAGSGRPAAQHRSPEKGHPRVQQDRLGAPEEALRGRRRQQAGLRSGRAGLREFQG